MHRLATILKNGQNNNTQPDNVIFVEQQPAPIVIITGADTDIQTLAAAYIYLGDRFAIIQV